MRQFNMVGAWLWASAEFTELENDDARYVYLYLLTNVHTHSSGCYRLPEAYAIADLGWKSPKYRNALKVLATADLIVTEGDEIFVCDWYEHSPVNNPDHRAGVEKHLNRLQSRMLREHAMAKLEDSAAGRRKARGT